MNIAATWTYGLNLMKCHFLTKEIEYLDYNIKNHQVKPNIMKVIAIKKVPTPKDVHQRTKS
ncbi:hypothetical protein ABEB36_003728 [Hypothenemus hampei]|uniref:Uncharacterized protein n=1 Tax=Hypothenemus hampei TaxID=57062 RepID=A0ABD1F0X1_HYPHA